MKPFKPPVPVATNVIIGLCVAVQAAITLAGPGFGGAVRFSFGLVPARIAGMFAGTADWTWALPTLVTHEFVHSGWLHLGLNLLFLAWVGRYVEWVAGRRAVAVLFIAGGIAGGALQVATDPVSLVPVVGASGAIASVFGAYAVLFAQSRATPRRVLGIAVSGETVTALWYAATWIGLQLLTAAVFNTGADGSQIAIWTHIGGFVTGLLLARTWGRGTQAF